MKRIFIIDWCLIPLFLLAVFTGIELHISAHGNSHELWHTWALAHIIASFLFTVFVVTHVKTHWRWYKSHVTVAVSFVFIILAMTGYALLGVNDSGSGLGMWHYRIGLLVLALFGGHIIKRIPVLRKTIKKIDACKTLCVWTYSIQMFPPYLPLW